MAITQPDPFVRIPSDLLEVLLRARLSRLQWRIVLWVVRHTFGWNRSWTPFSWYGMARDLNANRGTVFRAGARLLQSRVLRCAAGRLGIQPEFASSDRAIVVAGVAREQRWITHERIAKKQRQPLLGGNETVATEQRFSVERKTGVKTELQRRRRGGYVDNCGAGENDAVRELMDAYVALSGKALSAEQTATLYERFHQSAKALLDTCSGNLQEAKAVLRQSLALTKPET